ncbi:MAG: CHAT domain-containing protein [Rhodobacteraceae bacterium]|nr:CHAT domain-containing protein [Paracoccaceae bacterium]
MLRDARRTCVAKLRRGEGSGRRRQAGCFMAMKPRLPLYDAELVTLSACETAPGVDVGADGIYSLGHAFLRTPGRTGSGWA